VTHPAGIFLLEKNEKSAKNSVVFVLILFHLEALGISDCFEFEIRLNASQCAFKDLKIYSVFVSITNIFREIFTERGPDFI